MPSFVVDIETVPQVLAADATEEVVKQHSLSAINGQIASIALLQCEDFRPSRAVVLVGDDESSILRAFWETVGTHRRVQFVAHNGLSFDLPFIWRRSVIRNIRPTLSLDLRRFNSAFVYDTMCVWSNWEPRSSVSLNVLAETLGFGGKSGQGSEVWSLWRDRKFQEIANYCFSDVWLTYLCWCQMNFVAPVNSAKPSPEFRELLILQSDSAMPSAPIEVELAT